MDDSFFLVCDACDGAGYDDDGVVCPVCQGDGFICLLEDMIDTMETKTDNTKLNFGLNWD